MSADPSPLLRIDHEAALAKLAWSQLHGPWELPAELARLAIAAGARAISLEVSARGLALSAREARLEHRLISDFASVLDRDLEPAERHRALVDLEQQDAIALAAIACSTVRSLTLTTGGDDGMKLELRAGELRVSPSPAAVAGRGVVDLTIDGLAIDSARAVRWLSQSGRFARAATIVVNGRRVDRGFRDALIRAHVAATAERPATASAGFAPPPSLPAAVSIPARGGAPRLWLLRHGIVVTRATVPGYPPFEAAVEMAPVASASLGAAALRERLGPYLRSLLDGALSLALRLARDPGTLSEETRARASRVLLEGLRQRRRVAEISGAKIFPLVCADGRRWVSIDEIARRVRVETGGACSLEAIPPGQDERGFAISERGAVVLNDNERALLGDHLCVVFSAPPAHLRRSWSHRLAAGLAALAPALRPVRGRPLADHELTPGERAFLSHLRSALASALDGRAPGVGLRSGRPGRDRPAVLARGRLTLARSHPDVELSIRAVADDPSWIYPALVCLFENRPLAELDLRRSEPRRQWFSGAL